MSYPCPHCRTPATLDAGCPGCGRGPDPDAAEVVRLDAEIARLGEHLAGLRRAERAADEQLRDTWLRRHAAAARVRAAVAARPAATPAPAPAPMPASVPAPRTPEASTRLVQNALFLLGGLLLGVAAIVFTAVAWAQFGVGGRAALLAGFTAAALAVPPLALRRGLTATAETFAAVGLLLVLLDGYAAWYVNLFGVSGHSASGYAGAVCAVTAVLAAGYQRVTGLTGPRYAALVVAQPVLPLLVAPLGPDATGWSYTLAAVALLNLAVARLNRRGPAVTAYAFASLAVLLAGLAALLALAVASAPAPAAAAASALVTAALVVLAGAWQARLDVARSVAGGLLVVAVGVGGGRFLDVAGGERSPLLISALVAVLAVAAAGARRVLPPVVGRGPWAGAVVLLVLPVTVALIGVADSAARTVAAAQPFLRAALDAPVDPVDGQLLAVVALLAVGVTALVPPARWRAVALGSVALLALALPAVTGLPWWTAPALDLPVAAAALAVATRRRRVAGWCATAAVLAAHAVTVGLGRPGVAAATFGGVMAAGIGTAVLAWPTPRRRGVGGGALLAGLLAVPAAGWAVAAASSAPGVWQARAALAAAVVVAAVQLVVSRRRQTYRPFAAVAAAIAAVGAPLWALGSGDSPAVYAALGLVLVATTAAVPGVAVTAAVPLTVAVALAAGAGVLAVLAAPYGWLGEIWTGRPAGIGIDPAGVAPVSFADSAAVALVAVAVAVWRWCAAAPLSPGTAWAAGPAFALAVPMGLAAGGVPWPGVPAASLVIGVAGLLLVALRRPGAPGVSGVPAAAGSAVPGSAGGAAGAGLPAARSVSRAAAVVVSAALVGAGLAGALPTHAATIAALGVMIAAGAAAGSAGRDPVVRMAARPIAVAAALALAFTAGRAGGLSVAATALPVLAAAALALAAGTALSARADASGAGRRAVEGRVVEERAVEGRAVQAAAHAGAVVALLLAAGSARHAAAVCALWGVALGVRALRPGERTVTRHVLVVAAAAAEVGGWWLLVAAEQVATPEVYTLPAAAVALLAGRLALRSRPELTSWIAYGPALAAALLPTCASVLVADGQPVRRLALGAGALAVVLAGTYARLQAPVVIGGGVLAVVALHELILVWDLLPRWIPLAIAGLLLVALAMTLERRRRDLARVRAALHRMS